MRNKATLLALTAGFAAWMFLHDRDKPEGNYAKIATLTDGRLYRNLDTGDVFFVFPGGSPSFVRNVPLDSGWQVDHVSGDTINWLNVGGAENGRRYAWTMSAQGAVASEGYA